MTPPRVLVVEDDPSWQQLFSRNSKRPGFLIETAENLIQSEQILHEQTHRLLVADLSLAAGDHNNTDGLAVLRGCAPSGSGLPGDPAERVCYRGAGSERYPGIWGADLFA